ncbi:MAG: DUF1460 domain-containing protein [Muribaculaceae bacterium]|nr:DUF1460 domain-containing protein [Muribaculaceae bacterium]
MKIITKITFIMMLAMIMPAHARIRMAAPADTVRAARMVNELRQVPVNGLIGPRVAAAAVMLIDMEGGQPLDNDSIGTAIIGFERTDGLGMVNMAMALAKAAGSPLGRWQDYGEALVNVSRRRGEDTGFASKMIYGADWVTDNVYRGNVTDLTERYSGSNVFKTKSLDKISFKRADYPALADSATYDALRMVEMGYRTHKIPHLKKETINKKDILNDLRDGDIIMMLGSDPRFDIYDIGIVHLQADGPHFIHVSPSAGKVVEEADPLPRWFKKENQYFYGYRWLRPE